jgi:uncharacterized protein (TIGR03435 family)
VRVSVVRPAAGAVFVLCATLAAQEAPPAFEVASIRQNTVDKGIPYVPNPPDGITLINRPLESLVRFAYDVQFFRVVGMPAWANEERFDIDAKAGRPITEAERRLMLRSLLIERFGLKTHFEQREQTVYVMTRVRPDDSLGRGLKPRPDCAAANSPCVSGGSAIPPAGRLSVNATTSDALATGLVSSVLESMVVNESKLEGRFDVELSWRPENLGADPNDSRPSFFTAVAEQWGMKLTAQRRPVDVLVIDQIDRPKPN